jgi:hypothetical protein
MTQYNCIRCGYSTNHKGTFIRHIERVRRCKAISRNVGKNEIYKHNLLFDKILENTQITQNCQRNVNVLSTLSTLTTLGQNNEKCQRNVNVMSTLNEDVVNVMSTLNEDVVNVMSTLTQNDKKSVNVMSTLNEEKIDQNSPTKKKKIYKCKFCRKQFNTRQSKSRHEKESCPIKLKTTETNQQLLKQLEEKDKQIYALIENVQKKNTLPYESTNRQFLTDDMISICMQKQNRCVPEIIKLVHFSEVHPENRNLYIRNLKTGYIITYDGQDWIIKDKNDMLDKIISDNEKFMHTKFMEWYDDSTKRQKYKKAIGKFEKYIKQSSNQELIKSVKDELKIMLYNIKNKIGSNDYLVTELKEN